MKRICLALVFTSLASAQNPPARLAFEVASIRPGLSGNLNPRQFEAAVESGKFHRLIDDSRIDFGSVTLVDLILTAYRIPADRLVMSGAISPEQLFDISAKLPDGAKKEQVPEMLQTLLAERFKLAVHHEQKVIPVYLLTVAKDGPKLHDSTADAAYSACNGGYHKVCRKMTMEALANDLTRISQMNTAMPGSDLSWGIDRPVVDSTGLKGVYDFDMEYGISRGAAGRGGAGAAPAPPAGETRSVMDALKDLGLRLEPAKHEFDNLIIDRVERVPTDN